MNTQTSNTSLNTADQRSSALSHSGSAGALLSLRSTKGAEIFVSLMLFLAALLPRLFLARRLDVVTDEVVYILGGKIYFPLLIHLRIGDGSWNYNYEHPPFVKLLIGMTLTLNTWIGHPLRELVAARLPSIFFGALLVVAVYWLGRAPFGRVVALLAALCLACSPWLVYFSALAYLDMTMATFISIAYLLLWPALRRPMLYLLIALLLALAAASKYPAVLMIPGMTLFTLYYFLFVRPRLPLEQRPPIPWLWWLAAIVLAPLTFLAADPAIWPHPIDLLNHSFRFEENHSANGHLTFFAGQARIHMPQWTIFYTVFVKMSAFITIPALFFIILALVQLVRFHLRDTHLHAGKAAELSFLLIWLVSALGMFSLLNIVVGTHYYLPTAAPIVLAGVSGLAALFRYRRGSLFAFTHVPMSASSPESGTLITQPSLQRTVNWRTAIVAVAMMVLAVVPHLVGLVTVSGAEGYTSEFFPGENTVLQVAYPGYRDALLWLAAHTNEHARVGLVALPFTLTGGGESGTWFRYNRDLSGRFSLSEAHPQDRSYPYDYLVWPMHLLQRGFPIPAPWRSHVVYTVMGGKTVYCYVLAHPPGRT